MYNVAPNVLKQDDYGIATLAILSSLCLLFGRNCFDVLNTERRHDTFDGWITTVKLKNKSLTTAKPYVWLVENKATPELVSVLFFDALNQRAERTNKYPVKDWIQVCNEISAYLRQRS